MLGESNNYKKCGAENDTSVILLVIINFSLSVSFVYEKMLIIRSCIYST